MQKAAIIRLIDMSNAASHEICHSATGKNRFLKFTNLERF